MTEETAIRIAEALESIDGTIRMIGTLALCWTVFFGVSYLISVITKD